MMLDWAESRNRFWCMGSRKTKHELAGDFRGVAEVLRSHLKHASPTFYDPRAATKCRPN